MKEIWNECPSVGFWCNASEDSNNNCGPHGKTLNFHPTQSNKVQCGTLTAGRHCENGHSESGHGRQCCKRLESNWKLISKTCEHLTLHSENPVEHLEFLRVSCVNGAQSVEHTDTFRGATPNCVFVRDESNFVLRVRNFPPFQTSVAMHKGKHCVPHTCKAGNGLCMMGWLEKPTFCLFQDKVIEDLEPVGEMPCHTVVGVKGECNANLLFRVHSA